MFALQITICCVATVRTILHSFYYRLFRAPRVSTQNQDREPTAQSYGTVRETNTEENLQMLCVIRQVQTPESIFYDDEDTALLLHCKFEKTTFKQTACLAQEST